VRRLALVAALAACGGGEGRRARDADLGPCAAPGDCLVKERWLPTVRGEIVDRRGAPLALDVPGGRQYPQGALAGHVLGYVSDKHVDDRGGVAGIERLYDVHLAGKRGVERYVLDARGRELGEDVAAAFVHGDRVLPGTPGHRVVLSLDAGLQRVVEAALAPHGAAAAVVVEVATGWIRALASTPAYDPNVLSSSPTTAQLTVLEADPRRPFLDRTTQRTYLADALLAFLPDGEAAAYGLGAVSGLGLNAEQPGRVPKRPGEPLEATPLQVAMAYAALTHGALLVPQLVERVETLAGKRVVEHAPREVRKVKVPSGVTRTGGNAAVVPTRTSNRHASPGDAWYAGWAPGVAIVVLVEDGGDRARAPAEIAEAIAAAVQ
jgi:cell division protein FtsI/penicillin-binding protein 2